MLNTGTFTAIQNSAGLPAWNALITPAGIINLVIPYLYGAAGIILLVMLTTSGYSYMFSRGDPKGIQVAQSRITTSLIGLFLLFASFWIVKLVGQFFGITIFGQLFT